MGPPPGSITSFIDRHSQLALLVLFAIVALESFGAIGRNGLYAAGGALLLTALGSVIVKRVQKRVVEEDGSDRPVAGR